jgi:signal transduction histidine kinase
VTVVFGVVVALAITGGIVLLYVLQLHAVDRTVRQQLRTYATQLSQTSPTGNWPQPLPVSALDSSAQAQVIAADGTVLAATRGLTGVPATFALPPGAQKPVRLKAADGVIPREVHVVGLRVTVAGKPVLIIAGSPVGVKSSLTGEFLYLLVFGFPVLFLLSALLVWLLVGRALKPVTRIRQAVTDITSADLARRVPDPGTADEIGHLARTMNDMLDRLESSVLRQRRFVADASHELRTPLTAIRTTLDVALAHADHAPWPAVATRALDQTHRLERLIQDLLVLAKSDENAAQRPHATIAVNTLLSDVVSTTVARNVTLDLEPDPESSSITGNAADLSRLLHNVVQNAIRYAASTVRVSASSSDTMVRIRVCDDGPGVPPEDRDRVFNRFVRLDASRNRASGNSGLGLAIVRDIAEAHGGRVWFDEPLGAGAVVVIELARDGHAERAGYDTRERAAVPPDPGGRLHPA